MSYSLVYTQRAAKDIRSLDRLVQRQLAKAFVEMAKDPLAKSKKLIHAKIGTYRFRLGDYRIVFDIHGEKVVILRVGHRREIYR